MWRLLGHVALGIAAAIGIGIVVVMCTQICSELKRRQKQSSNPQLFIPNEAIYAACERCPSIQQKLSAQPSITGAYMEKDMYGNYNITQYETNQLGNDIYRDSVYYTDPSGDNVYYINAYNYNY